MAISWDDRNAIAADPSTSYWLKEAIRRCEQRDPVDALCDAEVLVALLQSQLDNHEEPP
jgi:tellurite resistance protein